jgi:hypothetical protein
VHAFASRRVRHVANSAKTVVTSDPTIPLEVGALLSSGVCNVCEQCETHGVLLLCDEEACLCAVYIFCAGSSALYDPS